jgi:Trk-type K+ transport system membrane component
MEVYFVYGLVVLFFLGMVGIVAFVIIPNNQQIAIQSQESARQAQLDGKQNNIVNYGIVAVLFLLLIAFTFVAKKAQPGS